jgi:hypothetical protein
MKVIEEAMRAIVDYVNECGITGGDYDQDATQIRTNLTEMFDKEPTVELACAVAAGVWILQGTLKSLGEVAEDERVSRLIDSAANLAITWISQIHQGAQAAEIMSELMATEADVK